MRGGGDVAAAGAMAAGGSQSRQELKLAIAEVCRHVQCCAVPGRRRCRVVACLRQEGQRAASSWEAARTGKGDGVGGKGLQ